MTGMSGTGHDLPSANDELLGPLAEDGGLRAWKLDPAHPPLFIAPASARFEEPGALPDWIQRNRAGVDALLLEHGGLVFRGFAIHNSAEFNRVIDQFPRYSGDYKASGSRRARIEGEAYEVTPVPPPMKISLHQEMPHAAQGPKRIMFYCQKPAEQGGETIICDMRRITRELSPSIREKLERLGIVYERFFGPVEDGAAHGTRSWRDAFVTDDRAQVEATCRERGSEPVWHPDGGLTVRTAMPAFVSHEMTDDRVYRAMLHCAGRRYNVPGDLPWDNPDELEAMAARPDFGTGCFLGDGTELTPAEESELVGLFNATQRVWPWQAGDIMLLDNLLTAHGRNAYRATRNVQVAILD